MNMGRWAKSHDQRKGQWLINNIRKKFDYSKIKTVQDEKWLVEVTLWDMENNEYDEIMGEYEK